MRVIINNILAGLGLLAGLGPASAAAVDDEQWSFGATLYAWLPGISGRTQFPSGAGGPSINVNAKDVLSKLDTAFMGAVEARRGRWGGLADWVYSDLSADRGGTRDLSVEGVPPGAGVSANVGLRVKTNVLTLVGTYAAFESPTNSTSIVAGMRMLKTDQTLNWSLAGTGSIAGLARAGVADAGMTNWDVVAGVRGRARLEKESRWFLPYHLDVGTGSSRLTWQTMVGVGYAFDFGDVGLVWRYLDYTFDPADAVQTLTFNGLALGVAFRF